MLSAVTAADAFLHDPVFGTPCRLRPQGRRLRARERARLRAQAARHPRPRSPILRGQPVQENAGVAGRRLLPLRFQRDFHYIEAKHPDPALIPPSPRRAARSSGSTNSPTRSCSPAERRCSSTGSSRRASSESPGRRGRRRKAAQRDELPPILDYVETSSRKARRLSGRRQADAGGHLRRKPVRQSSPSRRRSSTPAPHPRTSPMWSASSPARASLRLIEKETALLERTAVPAE